MQCFYCGNEVDSSAQLCPYCGVSLTQYRTILLKADALYNEGLEKAKVRDLSGAVVSLKESLRFNKYHTNARNLLGLVYFETGDTVQALSEWVISKNFQPENNGVDLYLDEIQNTPGMLDKMNTTIKKYNQAIDYCNQGSRDLARIQLRRVLGMNDKLVKGHQLLALLCIQDGEYEEARKSLIAASKIDVRNTTTLRYMQEVKAALKEQNQNSKKRRKTDENVFLDNPESQMVPKATIADIVDNSKGGLMNVIIGLAVGLLVTVFLIVPTVKQNANQDAANELVSANEEMATTTGSVEALNAEVEALREKLTNYESMDDIASSYDNTILAYNAYSSGDYEKAYSTIATVNPDLLSTTGRFMYDIIAGAKIASEAKEYYDEANSAYWKKDYEKAAKNYLLAVEKDPKYDNGAALFYLAESYRAQWDFENAKTYYTEYLQLFPEGYFSHKCENLIEELGGTVEE